MPQLIRIHPDDNVAVALRPVPAGTVFEGVMAQTQIPQGHKMALRALAEGEKVVKYGLPIGHATDAVGPGQWVHTHNMATDLSGKTEHTYTPVGCAMPKTEPRTFRGFRRHDGGADIRNEIWIIPTVGCVNDVAKALVRENGDLVTGSIEGIYAFPHPYGCSQTGEDHARTRKLLASLAKHPNAGAVLIVGLGCENLTREQFLEELGDFDRDRIKFLLCQEVEDELAEACKAIRRRRAELGDDAD